MSRNPPIQCRESGRPSCRTGRDHSAWGIPPVEVVETGGNAGIGWLPGQNAGNGTEAGGRNMGRGARGAGGKREVRECSLLWVVVEAQEPRGLPIFPIETAAVSR